MLALSEASLVAAIAACGAIAAATIPSFIAGRVRRENRDQHAASVEALNQVASKVDVVGSKLDEHIGWHRGHDDVTPNPSPTSGVPTCPS